MSTPKLIFTWILRLIAALIMVQSLFFKFSGSIESVEIFSKLGMEPWGRIGTGVVELIASVLILFPRTTWLGAGTGLGTMMGAIFFHLTTLGIEVKGDGGQLFIYAVITAVSCLILLFFEKQKIVELLRSTFQNSNGLRS